MKTQSYYKLPTKVEGYALAVYQSKVVLIGGNVPSSQNHRSAMAPSGDPKCPIIVFDDDCGLEERLKSALDRVLQKPQARNQYVYEIGKNACAVGEGNLLIVIGGDGMHKNTLYVNSQLQELEYVRVFDGQNWSCGAIGITRTTGSTDYSVNIRNKRKTLFVFQNRVYMTACGDSYPRVFFCCISLDCFRNLNRRKAPLSWNLLEDVPDGAACTNLSVLGNQLVTVGVVDGGFRMYCYLARSSKWLGVHVHEFLPSDVNSVSSITGIIGLRCSNGPDQVEALLVGAHQHLTRIYKLTTKCKLIFSTL
jgi:hypothetical protein